MSGPPPIWNAAGRRTLRFSGCGFRFNFNLALNGKQHVILPTRREGPQCNPVTKFPRRMRGVVAGL